MIYIIKRDGRKAQFNRTKIERAVEAAFIEVDGTITEYATQKSSTIANFIEKKCNDNPEKMYTVEEIQDLVENGLMSTKRKDVARAYITYRNERTRERGNSIDKEIDEIASGTSDYWNHENSNKNSMIVTTQRDYFAGSISTDITMRKLLPRKIVKAHEEGIIHFHDSDYFAQNALNNCSLINLDDMLRNGTVINDVMIEPQHRFITASTVSTQIILGVSSSQYGGCTISLTHLAPYIRMSFISYLKESIEWVDRGDEYLENIISGKVKWPGFGFIESNYPKSYKYAMSRTKKEVKDGVQTFNYQVNSMTNTNGQAPFLTVNMYLGETEEYKEELAMAIEEFLNQRILGFKNKDGVYITPAFPKLIYVLEEDNIYEDSKYWYLTELAAKCTAKRLVPDYVSEKVMKSLKVDEKGNGNCYPPMGCVDGKEVITYKIKNKLYVESFERMWNRLMLIYPVKFQYGIDNNKNLYMDLSDVFIYDTMKTSFTVCKRIIRNVSSKWIDVTLSNGRRILCTNDHPFETMNRGTIHAEKLIPGDKVLANYSQYSEENFNIDPEFGWTLGFMLYDGCYQDGVVASIAATDADDIEYRFKNNMKSIFDIDVESVFQERGQKETYKDLKIIDNFNIGNNSNIERLQNYFNMMFEGNNKNVRHIPNEVFEWNYGAKLAFMAGMIDADGYIDGSKSIIQIGSTNKELAIQQMLLAQSIGCRAKLYYNHYNSTNPEAIRYRVEFVPSLDLINFVSSQKKKDYFSISPIEFNKSFWNDSTIEVISLRAYNFTDYSYDVTTESEHFEVSGIYSHNCRSFLTPYVDKDGNPKYYGRLTYKTPIWSSLNGVNA